MRSPLSGLLPVALVCSGFAALAVEVLWQRLLTPVLGGSTVAVTAVLMVYMGGLALGAWLSGRRGDHLTPERALRAYGRLEVLIWLGASLVTLILGALPVGLGGALSLLPEGTVRFLGRFTLASLILLIPITAMGATLPLAVRAAVGGAEGRLLRGTGLLYAANTAGAVLGALVGPLVLLPAFGLRRAALVGAAGSLVAAVIARAATSAPEGETDDSPPEMAAPTAGLVPFPLVALATFATGAAALGLEVVWTRALGTVAGSTVYAFGAVLALVLGGLTIGSAVVSRLSERVRWPASTCALLAVIGPTAAILLFPLLDRIPLHLARLAAEGRLTLHSSLATVLSVGAAVILPPTLCFGAALPLAVRAVRSPGSASARSVGRIYVVNTIGALTGAAGTGLFLMPTLGQARAAAILALLPVAAGILLFLLDGRAAPGQRPAPRRVATAAALGVAAGLAIALAPAPSPYVAAAGTHTPRTTLRGHVVYYGEGPEASVLVEATGHQRTFFVAGRPEASDLWQDVRIQYLLGHLPALLAGQARESLVIGLGSGMTAGALTRHGDVLIAELNRAVPEATRQFADLNHDVLRHARLSIEDGRVFLTRPGALFDVVTTDPIHPYVAGSATLYTSEHLALSKAHLQPNGAVSLWVPLHQMGLAELKAIVGSFVDVFPDAELYLSHNNVILLGGGRSGEDRLARFGAGWTPAVAADLRRARIGSPEELNVQVVAGPDALRRFVAGARRNLDDDPWIEFSLPVFIYWDTLRANLEALLALRDPAAAAHPLVRAYDATQRSYLAPPARGLDLLRDTLVDGQSPLLEHAIRMREVSVARARELLREGRRDEALALARTEAAHPSATPESLLGAEDVLRSAHDFAGVDAVTARLALEWPDRPEGHLRAGEALFERARFREAIPALERGLALDRFQGFAIHVLGLLGRAYLMNGELDRGRSVLRQALARDPDQPALLLLVGGSAEALTQVRRQLEEEATRRGTRTPVTP